MKKKLFLLSGYSGSGKSYIADILKDKGWKSIALADHLKDIVSEQFDISRDDLDSQDGKRKIDISGKSYRQLLIDKSKKIKSKDTDYFSRKVVESIKLDDSRDTVISDLRYPHEYYYIKTKLNSEYDIKCIRVKRDTYNKINDESELSLDNFNFDYILLNDETLHEKLNELANLK